MQRLISTPQISTILKKNVSALSNFQTIFFAQKNYRWLFLIFVSCFLLSKSIQAQTIIAQENFDGGTPNWNNNIASLVFTDPNSPNEGLFIQAASTDNANFSGNTAYGRDLQGETGEPTINPINFVFDDVDVSAFTNVVLGYDFYVFANADIGTYTVVLDGVDQAAVEYYNDPETGLTGSISVNIPAGTNMVGLKIGGTLNAGNDVLELDNFSLTGTAASSCTATLAAGNATCDALTSGVDTYNTTFTFTIGTETEALTVNVSSGTADVATINADGTITVTGVNEGTNLTLTLSNSNCTLVQMVTSPTCNPIITPPSGITATGTCQGITTANENNYNITITGLDATETYDFDLDGDNVDDVMGITGMTSYTTTTPIAFVDGTNSTTVQIDAGANGIYETSVIVHEVLCTDADDDGDLDFDSGCDDDLAAADRGYIVATAAPYTGNNVYVYVLTNATDNALEANTAGLFTGLASGGNGTATDYNVVAFNFSSSTDAADFIASLTFGAAGTSVTTSTTPTGCAMACGTMAYDIECCISPVATVNDPTICEATTMTTFEITTTAGTPVTYSIDFDDPAITDITATAIPASNMIEVTLPATLAAGNYTGTITFTEFPGCTGMDNFTITIDPATLVEAGTTTTICSTGSIDLTSLGATISGGTTMGTWSSTTGGTFDDGAGVFGTAITYTPSATEIAAGTVTLTLTSAVAGACPTVVDTVTISISNVNCGTFPWSGN